MFPNHRRPPENTGESIIAMCSGGTCYEVNSEVVLLLGFAQADLSGTRLTALFFESFHAFYSKAQSEVVLSLIGIDGLPIGAPSIEIRDRSDFINEELQTFRSGYKKGWKVFDNCFPSHIRYKNEGYGD